MPSEAGENEQLELVGRPIEDAAELVVERGVGDDLETVQRELELVAKDGIVSWEGAREAFANVSKVVATPETRLELATDEMAETRDVAEPFEDLPIVQNRLEGFQARLYDIESRIDDLGKELRKLLDRLGESGALYEVAQGIHQLNSEANNCQHMADELQVDLEEVQRWLTDPSYRHSELKEDIDALEGSIDDLAATANAIANPDDGGSWEGQQEPIAETWFDAVLQSQVLNLVIEDLRWELNELRKLDGRAGDDNEEVADEIESLLDDLTARRSSLADRLNNLSQSDWLEGYEDNLRSVESDLEEIEPPVDWATVESTLESHRQKLGGSS